MRWGYGVSLDGGGALKCDHDLDVTTCMRFRYQLTQEKNILHFTVGVVTIHANNKRIWIPKKRGMVEWPLQFGGSHCRTLLAAQTCSLEALETR
jgi:hypothetical protein